MRSWPSANRSGRISNLYFGFVLSVGLIGAELVGVTGASGFLVALIVSIVVGIGFMFLIIPGLILLVMLSLAPYLVGREEIDAMSALSRSWQLVSKSFWSIVLLDLVVGVVVIVVSMILGFIPVIGQAASVLMGLFLMPVAGAIYEELSGGKAVASSAEHTHQTAEPANEKTSKDDTETDKSEESAHKSK